MCATETTLRWSLLWIHEFTTIYDSLYLWSTQYAI